MKPLEKYFIGRGEVKGFKFTQLKATDLAYMYQVEDGGMIHYEVFEKRINARFGNISYPNSNAFGIWAWTFRDFDKAMRKFNELNKKEGLKYG